MAGWDTNFASTEAVGKNPFNVLAQLCSALWERYRMAGGASPPWYIEGEWDSTVTYDKYESEKLVTRAYNDKGAWSSVTNYVKYDSVNHYVDKGAWAKATAYNKYELVTFIDTSLATQPILRFIAKQNDTGHPPMVLEWVALTSYTVGDRVTRSGGTYISIVDSLGKDPLTEPTYWTAVIYDPTIYWWRYGEAPRRVFYARQASLNKSPYTETAYWAVEGSADVPINVFSRRFVAGNLNKDPFTEPTYWSQWSYSFMAWVISRKMPASARLTGAGNSWFERFQNTITAQLALHADHTLNGGDFNDQPLPIYWTEATMLAAIGDATRIPFPTAKHMYTEWCWQQYKIINMLRWPMREPENYSDGDTGMEQRSAGSGGSHAAWNTAYNAALTNYNLASWTAYADWGRWPSMTYRSGLLSGGVYTCSLYNYRRAPQYNFSSPLQFKTKAYVFFVSRAFLPGTLPSAGWEYMSGDGFIQDTIREWGRDLVERTIVTGNTQLPVKVEQLVQSADDPPTVAGTTQLKICALRVQRQEFDTETPYGAWARFIFRCDGPNGFVYKDW